MHNTHCSSRIPHIHCKNTIAAKTENRYNQHRWTRSKRSFLSSPESVLLRFPWIFRFNTQNDKKNSILRTHLFNAANSKRKRKSRSFPKRISLCRKSKKKKKATSESLNYIILYLLFPVSWKWQVANPCIDISTFQWSVFTRSTTTHCCHFTNEMHIPKASERFRSERCEDTWPNIISDKTKPIFRTPKPNMN